MTVTNQNLQELADRTDAGRTNPVRSAAIRRFLDHLPPGPCTQAELLAELDQLDLADLADSTAATYRSALQGLTKRFGSSSFQVTARYCSFMQLFHVAVSRSCSVVW